MKYCIKIRKMAVLSGFILYIYILLQGSYCEAISKETKKSFDIVSDLGKIYVTFKNTPANSKYRWETVGWAVTLQPLNSDKTTVENYDYTAIKQRVLLMYGDGYYRYNKDTNTKEWIKSCDKKELGKDEDGKLVTYYEFDEGYVQKQFNDVGWSNLPQGVTLYFHGIFATYQLKDDNTKHYYQDIKNPKELIYNWHDIAYYSFPNIGTWSSDEVRSDFRKYYNNAVPYDPAPQTMKVVYKFDCIDDAKDVTITKYESKKSPGKEPYYVDASFAYNAKRKMKYIDSENDEYYKNIEFEYQKTIGYTHDVQNKDYRAIAGERYQIEEKDEIVLKAKVPLYGMTFYITYKEIPKVAINYTRLSVTRTKGNITISDTLESERKLGEAKEGSSFSWKGSTDPKITEQYQWKKGQKGKAVSGKAGEDIYILFGYYISIGENKQKIIESGKNSVTLQDIMEGSISNVKKGMTVNFLYEKAPKHPVSYVRELIDGTVLQEETVIDNFYPDETYTWKVKAMLDYNEETKKCKEIEMAKDDSSLELVRVKIVHNKDHTLLETIECAGSSKYSGNFKVKPMGETIYYIYKKSATNPKKYPVSYQRETETGVILQSKKKLTECFDGEEYEWSVKGYLSLDASSGACKERDVKDGSNYELVNVKLEYLKDQSVKTVASASGKNQYSGRITVPKKGVILHYVYKEMKGGVTTNQHPVYYRRETETGMILQNQTMLGEYKKDATCQWEAKAYLSYNKETKSCREMTSKIPSCYELVRVIIEQRKDGSIASDISCNGKSSYEGSFKVLEQGIVIRYIYKGGHVSPRIKEEIPEPEVREASYELPEVQGEIQADTRSAKKYDVSAGIPTTESLYVQVQGTRYLLGYTLTKRTGEVTYRVPVKATHSMKWESAQGKPALETYVQEGVVDVTRAYGYWEITRLDYYTIDYANVSNHALPDGTVTIHANGTFNTIPGLTYRHLESQSSHVLGPVALQLQSTIELPGFIVSGEKQKPMYEYYSQEQLDAMVDERVGSNEVRNDYLMFDGTVVMQDDIKIYDTGDINESPLVACEELCEEDCLYQSDYIIDATKLNGQYHSSGSLIYRSVASVNSKYYGNPVYHSISNLNSVILHTPVYCKVEVTADNDGYVQLLNPKEGYLQLVLDERSSLNDFTVHISNYGAHSELKGYGTRDFGFNRYDGPTIHNRLKSYIQEKNGVLRNEVRFPFDAYLHTTKGEFEYIPKGTWVVLGRAYVTFHLPMWVEEGTYQVDCRTVAVNCREDQLTCEEEVANRNRLNYVATNQFMVEISGRIYGLHVYDLTDYPIWQEVFREENSLELKWNHPEQYPEGINQSIYSNAYRYDYTVGTKNQYGEDVKRLNKYTIPLVSGSHPKYKNIGTLKKGYGFRFSLDTIGNGYSDACKVIIRPTFWHVDEEGKNRIPVDLYYDEEIGGKARKLVKVGESLDAINLKQYRTGDPYLAIPEQELKETAKLRGISYAKFTATQEALFSFGEIRMNYAFRTFVNQAYREDIFHRGDQMKLAENGVNEADIDIRKQRWYGEYYLPGTVKVVQSGFDVIDYAKKYGVDDKSKFWIKDGYLIVKFDIVTIDANGNERLSYTNAENYRKKKHCCMYLMEGYGLEKQDFTGVRFSFLVGDVMIYDEKKKVKQDYKIGGSH